MTVLQALDVIWIHDSCIRPPGPKMVVCIEPHLGLFFRINTKDNRQTPVKLLAREHPFLDHNSHLECGEPLELDDYVIEQALERKPVLGKLSRDLVAAILSAVESAKTLSQRDKAAIRAALA